MGGVGGVGTSDNGTQTRCFNSGQNFKFNKNLFLSYYSGTPETAGGLGWIQDLCQARTQAVSVDLVQPSTLRLKHTGVGGGVAAC